MRTVDIAANKKNDTYYTRYNVETRGLVIKVFELLS